MNQPDPALLEIFLAEQAEHLQRMRRLIEKTKEPGAGGTAYDELLRRAHTLKGAARAVGFESTEMLVHALEGAFTALRSGRPEADAPLSPDNGARGGAASFFLRVLDVIEDIPVSIRAGRPVADMGELLRGIARISGVEPAAPRVSHHEMAAELPLESPDDAAADAPAEFVRIRAVWLDDLMRGSSELVNAAEAENTRTGEPTRAEAALHEWRRLRRKASAYVRSRLDDPEFAAVRECIEDADRQLQALVREIREETAQRRQREWELGRLTDRLQESALRVRMVSAETVFGGFGPMLRNLAKEHGKRIEFRAEGLDLPADRLVLQALKDPAMHLLRNALSHGIEPEEARIRAGKPAVGTIRLLLRSRGERMQMIVEDDGRGIDYRSLAEEEARQGIAESAIDASANASRSDEEVANLIFRRGFSTSSGLTTLSGRGMGLSIVRHEVNRLQGEIHLQSEPEKGLRITITVPLSLSTQQVLLVSAAGHTFGLLSSFVERLCRFEKSAIRTVEGRPVVMIDSSPVTVIRLAELLNLPAGGDEGASEEGEATIQAAVVSVGGNRAALAVDRLVDVRNAVVKPTGLEAEESGIGAGAIPMSDGSVAVILNAVALSDRFREAGAAMSRSLLPPAGKKRSRRILVVDDSITTRSLEKSLLAAHGYEVEVAVDGIDALGKLRSGAIDLVITDVMMPRMDGFQLLERIRHDSALAQIPVIVVSSMESREDQERGLALGADAYVVKRKFDPLELLKTVRQII